MSLVFEQVLKICKSMGVGVGEYNQEDGTFISETPSPDEPEMPRDLDCLSSTDLGNLMNDNLAWHSNLSTRLTEFTVHLETVQSQITNLETIHMAQVDEEDQKVTIKKAKIKALPEYQDLIIRRDVIKGVCTILEGAVKKADNKHKVISRVITVRQQEFDNNGRTNMGAGTYKRKPEKLPTPPSTSLGAPQEKTLGAKRVSEQK